MAEFSKHLQIYFLNKAKQLLAESQENIVNHSSLHGSHREEIIRVYLGDIIPKRFSVGQGVVYGPLHKSKECDIVIWDSQNYPSLPLRGHNFFFAESVKATIEIKSQWSTVNLKDILAKSQSVNDIILMQGPNLADDIAMLQLEVASLREGLTNEGMLLNQHRIATSAIILHGGQSFTLASLADSIIDSIDSSWPNIMLLLESGIVIKKTYTQKEIEENGKFYQVDAGYLELLKCGEDSLAIYTAELLASITERSVHVEDPFYFEKYLFPLLAGIDKDQIEFRLRRPIPKRIPLWK